MRLRDEGWPLTLIVTMFATAAVTWPLVPDTLPIHWSGDAPDGFAGRSVALLFLPIEALAFYCTLLILGRQHEADDTDHVWWWARTVITVSFVILYAFMQIGFWGYQPDSTLLLGILLSGFGCLRPFSSNSLIGVRTKWTLSSERSWQRSNRLFQRLMLALGPAMMVLALFDIPHLLEMCIAVLVAVTLGVSYYSYVEWREDQQT